MPSDLGRVSALTRYPVESMAVAGLAAAAISIFRLTPPADLALLGVVAFVLADSASRYAVLARREA